MSIIKNIFFIPALFSSTILFPNQIQNIKIQNINEKQNYLYCEVEKIINILSGVNETKNSSFNKEIKSWIEKNINAEIIIGRIFGKEYLKSEKKEIYKKIKDELIYLTASYCITFADQFTGYKIFGNKNDVKINVIKNGEKIEITKSTIPMKKIETKNKGISKKANVEITMILNKQKLKFYENSMIELKFFNDSISFSIIDFLIQKISAVLKKNTINGKVNIESTLNELKNKKK